ncbi:hypothetical protein [Piscinibacter gummiphilus]|uniref:Uncharacterized protein n=1 Tax=Piscinibacter gummiphilus TaxID=946333 RepID=A0ABZ0D3E6_9BURK|nr:hypothetical protein [Piscinibacter gummiphilus]WOB11316.1 hypothetical protein RXV79_27925 [Piscinibacter gummiphilus]
MTKISTRERPFLYPVAQVATAPAAASGYLKSPKALAELAEVATGLSHAEVARAVSDAIEEAVMHDQDTVAVDAVGDRLLACLKEG